MLIYWSTHTNYSQSNERVQINQLMLSICLVLIRGDGNEALRRCVVRTLQACSLFLSTPERKLTTISEDRQINTCSLGCSVCARISVLFATCPQMCKIVGETLVRQRGHTESPNLQANMTSIDLLFLF